MSKKNILLIVMSIVLFIILAIAINADILTGFESWIYFKVSNICQIYLQMF